jgi:hypothetical protein
MEGRMRRLLGLVFAAAIQSVLSPWPSAPARAETLVEMSNDVRTILAFSVPPEKVQALMPAGFKATAVPGGASKGANVFLVFIDRLLGTDGDGKPIGNGSAQSAVIALSASRDSDNKAVTVVLSGLSDPGTAPGAYGVFDAAPTHKAKRKMRSGRGPATIGEEWWEFTGPQGEEVSLTLAYETPAPMRVVAESINHSAKNPEFWRIYRVEQGVEVLRSKATNIDAVKEFKLVAKGGRFGELVEGADLVSITALPWYSRKIYLP